MFCTHGVNLKNRRCDACEESAAEAGRRRPESLEPERDDGEFFDIDIRDLVREWQRQPGRFRKYAVAVADARDRWERAKADKELCEAEMGQAEAEVNLDVRRNPAKYGLEKITEDTVKRVVLLQREYLSAQRKAFDSQAAVIGAKHDLDVAEVAVKTLEHKKKALEDLTQLLLADYFSMPRLPKGDARDHMDLEGKRESRKAGQRRAGR